MAGDSAPKTIDDILLPGTPERVLRDYMTLAQRADQTTFGLLEEDIVVLDTETTGLSFHKNELIEVAAARISGRTVVERFHSFVHPVGPIPPQIVELTGITNLDVMDAPRAPDVIEDLAAFVGGMPVVAHNASFDKTFIEAVRGGSEVTDTWIDSLALSRIALPRLSSHRLADMAQAFGCASVTHRAMDDVDALHGMWRIFMLGLSDLPHGLLERLATMHSEVDWPFRPLLSHLAGEQQGARFLLKEVRRDLVAHDDAHRRPDAFELERTQAPSPEDIERFFCADGPVSELYSSYESRPEQVAMSCEVAAALDTSSFRSLEAGTGVGKSMAYLLPEALFARQNDVTVGVATKTNALTDQLVSHELPALASLFPDGLSFVSLKGYEHYPCLHRMDLSAARELPLERAVRDGRSEQDVACDILTALAVTFAYVCQSPNGDLDALGIRWRYVPRDLLATSPAECIRARCPYYPRECLVHGARRRAASSDVVITNHSLLLRSIAADNAILPPIRHWVVDEAHTFEQEARRQWAHELTAEKIRATFQTLGGVSNGLLHSLLTRASKLDGATLVAGLLTKAASIASRASVQTTALLGALHDLMPLAGTNGGYESVTLWIDDHVRETDEWNALVLAAAPASASLDELSRALQEAGEAIAPESSVMSSELADSTRDVKDLLESLRLIVLEPHEAFVYSAELFRAKRRQGRERLVAERLDVGAQLAERWYPETQSVVYASATMAVGESFEHFEHAVGLDTLPQERRRSVRLDSSFDYDGNMSVVVARDMPAPNDRDYLAALEDLLYDIHRSMDGSVLTLFTNRREMDRVYAGLSKRLLEVGLDLACQEPGSSPRRLRERFLSEERLSLFALKSFWEGFDAAGDTLRCVVIPKLPFASPRDPLVQERELREQRSWWRYSLPEAVLSVKQAAGRLIRTSTDTGVLVLADSRICSKRYGRTFLGALQSHNCITLETRSIGRYITMWRASHER